MRTVPALVEILAQLIERDDGDVLVDLSEVAFMGLAIVGVFVRATLLLEVQSRSLVLQSPSVRAQRVLDLCQVTASPCAGPEGCSNWRR
jgi:anti-anti-sigma factor